MNAITTRYTPQVLERARAARASWRLRTEKFIGTAWQTMAVFPPAITEEQRGDQQKRLQRHAEAFGGLVRLMRAELLLAAWQDGELVCDLRGEAL
jgi:hypothetical protein